jgi:gamma-glutamylcyclotransferase (GGCT)/AIG2-like uncharacterized protein YtfP
LWASFCRARPRSHSRRRRIVMDTIEYFAYGSNMASATMRAICATERFCGPARLSGRRLAFTRRSVRSSSGVADIVRDRDRDVWGALYTVGASELEVLDHKEGRGVAYEREDVIVHDGDGGERRVMVYSVIAKRAVEVCPSQDYMRLLIAGGVERSLPADYVAGLRDLASFWGVA